MEDLSNLPPSAPQKPYGQSKSLAIALVVSAVFLLAAAGTGYWLLTEPANAPTAQAPTGDGSENVKNVTWVAPANVPVSYVQRDQNTPTIATSYYIDAAAGCSITTGVQPAQATGAVKQAVLDVAKSAQSYGIATNGSADSAETNIQNLGGRTYKFQGIRLEQSVAVAGIPYTAQRTNVAFKQFGQKIATIAYACRSDGWDAKHTELQQLIAAFKVKTE